MREYFYETCCVVSDPKDLETLYRHDRPIKADTFLRHVNLEGTQFEKKTMPPLNKDWHVRFYRSKWKGSPCYHMDHSAVDLIFTKRPDRMESR